MNSYIMSKYRFKESIIPPYVNDGRQAIGIGLYYFYKFRDTFCFRLENAYYGHHDIAGWGKICGEFQQFIKRIDHSLDYFVSDIVNGSIIWFDGCADWTESIGHRSILADPRQCVSKELLNRYKKR